MPTRRGSPGPPLASTGGAVGSAGHGPKTVGVRGPMRTLPDSKSVQHLTHIRRNEDGPTGRWGTGQRAVASRRRLLMRLQVRLRRWPQTQKPIIVIHTALRRRQRWRVSVSGEQTELDSDSESAADSELFGRIYIFDFKRSSQCPCRYESWSPPVPEGDLTRFRRIADSEAALKYRIRVS